MKIHRSVLFLIACVMLMASSSSVFGQMKIRYINSDKILQDYAGAQEVQKELDELRTTFETEFKKKEDGLKALVGEIQNQSLLLSPEKKAQKESEAQRLQAELEKYYYEKLGPQGEYFQENQKLIKPLQEKIQGVIDRVGQDEGYDLILDTVQGVVLYAKAEHDITEKILTELNKTQ